MRWLYRKLKNLIVRIFHIRKAILVPSLIIIVALVSFGIFKFVEFYDYMEHDPEFCLSCHIMEDSWDKWSTSEHDGIECHSCHKQSIFASMQQLFNYAFKNYETIEKHAEVPNDLCKNCHEDGSTEWIQVANTQGHKLHVEEQDVLCTECHSTSVHRFEPLTLVCNDCHSNQEIYSDKMAAMHCDTCHDFLVEQSETFHPSRESCLGCHEALVGTKMSWPADAPMQFDCSECHNPHDEQNPVVDCLECHEQPTQLHTVRAHESTGCITCHESHGWEAPDRDTCTSCHAGEVDHKEGFNCNICHDFK